MEDFPESNEEFRHLISSIDKKLKNSDSFYLDVEELIRVVDYFMDKGLYHKAKSVLKIGKNIHPNSTEIMFQMAQVFSYNSEYEKALEWLEKVQVLEPLKNEINLLRAEIYGFQLKHKKAIEFYLKFLVKANKDEKELVYNDLAWEYEFVEDFENALKYLKMALELNPKEDTILFEVAYFYEMLKLPKESIVFFEKFIDKNPYSYNAWYNLGNVCSDQKLYEKAVRAFDYASIIKPDFSSAYFNKGNAHFKLKEYQNAIECYFETFKFEDNQAITYCYVGECYEKLNNLTEAERHYELALTFNENIIEGLIGITLIKDRKGETLNGLSYIQKACKIYKENTECWYILAEVYEKLDRLDESHLAYQKAYDFSPDNVQLALDYSNYLAENHSVDRAIELVIDKEDIKIKYRMVAYYFILGQKLKALVLFEKCLLENYALHQELLEYYEEITKYSTFMKLVEKLGKNN